MKRQTMSSSSGSSDSRGVGALRMVVENEDPIMVKRHKPNLSHDDSSTSKSDDDLITNRLKQTSHIPSKIVQHPQGLKKTAPAHEKPQYKRVEKPEQTYKKIQKQYKKVETPEQYEQIRQQHKAEIQRHHLHIQTKATKQELYNKLNTPTTPDERAVIEEQLFKYIEYIDIKNNEYGERIILRNYVKKLLDMYNRAKFIINANIDPLLRLGKIYLPELDDLQSRIYNEIKNDVNFSKIALYKPVIVKIRHFERRCNVLYKLVYPGLNIK